MFKASNESILLPSILIIVASVVIGLIIIKKYSVERRIKILSVFLVTFCILYFPILEYWSIWIPNISFWPNDYLVDKSIMNDSIKNERFYDVIYGVLDLICSMLTICSVIIFTNLISSGNTEFNKREKLLVWIPFVNLFQIFIILKRSFHSKSSIIILSLWMSLTFIGAYYKFLAIYLAELGIDSFSVVELIIFGESSKGVVQSGFTVNSPIGYSYFLMFDLIRIIVPVFLWLSAILTLLIVKQIKTKRQQTLSSIS